MRNIDYRDSIQKVVDDICNIIDDKKGKLREELKSELAMNLRSMIDDAVREADDKVNKRGWYDPDY